MDTANLVEIFCIFDEFCKYFDIELKKHVIEDSNKRHRNRNFAANLLAGMIAYNLMPKKPSLNIEIIDKSRLIA